MLADDERDAVIGAKPKAHAQMKNLVPSVHATVVGKLRQEHSFDAATDAGQRERAADEEEVEEMGQQKSQVEGTHERF